MHRLLLAFAGGAILGAGFVWVAGEAVDASPATPLPVLQTVSLTGPYSN
jgi:hypothetical protein